MISAIVNTSALGPRAHEITGSRSPTPHAMRAYALRHFIIPSLVNFCDEVFVVGEWEDGEGYTYIPVPSVNFNCTDALAQRHAGYLAAKGDLLLFQHDDHWVASLPSVEAPVVSPRRVTIRGGRIVTLANGHPDYICGHVAMYRREVLNLCPWDAVPKVHTWDVEHTKMIHAAGFTPEYDPSWVIEDVEYGASPWL